MTKREQQQHKNKLEQPEVKHEVEPHVSQYRVSIATMVGISSGCGSVIVNLVSGKEPPPSPPLNFPLEVVALLQSKSVK